jgi:hypothetical protein
MVTLGVVTVIVIEGVVPHFNLLVTEEKLISDMIKPLVGALPEPVQKPLLLLWGS